MKIERLIGILSILLQQEKVTAPYLAEKFEVSRRTINRDIEDICMAGIPIVTTQGQNGGISIMEGFCIDRMLLTSSEMQSILSGLRSLDSVSGTNRYQQLMEKLSVGESSVLASNNHITINLSSWYKDTLTPKIELIQAAIEETEKISFTYYSPKGESRRTIEPNMLVFQWASWYVYGYCTDKESFRLFKLNRIVDLINTGEKYQFREVTPLDLSAKRIFPSEITIKAVFEPEMKWRLIEDFGLNSFEEQEDGKLISCLDFADKEYLFTWLLSFGKYVELIEPKELREEFLQVVNEISNRYR